MSSVHHLISEYIGLDSVVQLKIIKSIFAVIILFVVKYLISKIITKRLKRASSIYYLRKWLNYLFYFVVFIVFVRIYFSGLQPLATFFGLLSAGLAIALKEPLVNIAGWAFILTRTPFRVGDRIQIDKHTGDVIDIRMFQFTLMEVDDGKGNDGVTGRILHLPNSKIFTFFQANYDWPFTYLWDEIKIVVTFESNWKKAREILSNINKKHSIKYSSGRIKEFEGSSKSLMLTYDDLDPVTYMFVADSGIEFVLRYITEPRIIRESRDSIYTDIIDEFSKCNDIDFAYPTQRFFNHLTEGKERTFQNLNQS